MIASSTYAGPRRAICDRCGRAVWLREVGTVGLGPHTGAAVLQWVTRKGSTKPRECPVSDGYPMTYHFAYGVTLVYGP